MTSHHFQHRTGTWQWPSLTDAECTVSSEHIQRHQHRMASAAAWLDLSRLSSLCKRTNRCKSWCNRCWVHMKEAHPFCWCLLTVWMIACSSFKPSSSWSPFEFLQIHISSKWKDPPNHCLRANAITMHHQELSPESLSNIGQSLLHCIGNALDLFILDDRGESINGFRRLAVNDHLH